MADWHLAELNIARLRAPIDHPDSAGFVDQLDAVNERSEAAHGFVWRFVDDSGTSATGYQHDPDDPLLITNLSVWSDPSALRAFLADELHRKAMIRRREWFDPLDGPTTVLWWIRAGRKPTVHNGRDRLSLLDRLGPGPQAFGLRTIHDPPIHEPGRALSHSPESVTIGAEPGDSPDSVELLTAYVTEVVERSTHELSFTDPRMDPAEIASDSGGVFLVMRSDSGVALGCVAIRNLGWAAEFKRMYLVPEARGGGLGTHLLDAAHTAAKEAGHSRIVLDTKIELIEALDLYRSAGYSDIADYNENADATHWFARDL